MVFLIAASAILSFCVGAGGQNPPEQRPPVKWNNPDGPSISGVTHYVLHSPSMSQDVGYNVWLPPGYEQGTKRYPVVYFLHGAGGNENSDAGGFSDMVRKQIEAKAIPAVICVFPNGGMSGYADRPSQKVMGETLIVKELVPAVDSQFRTVASREGRALCGFSMGGGGAIRLALAYPELFSVAGSWAGAFGFRATEESVADIAKRNADKIRGKVRLLLVVGDKDLTYPAHPAFVDTLKELNLKVKYTVLEGVGHDLGKYHELTGTDMIKFVAGGLKGS